MRTRSGRVQMKESKEGIRIKGQIRFEECIFALPVSLSDIRPVVFKLECASESPRGPVKTARQNTDCGAPPLECLIL